MAMTNVKHPVIKKEAETIFTQFIYPPIPIRNYDWCAYRDPEKFTGYGKTELEAIEDLLDNERDFE